MRTAQIRASATLRFASERADNKPNPYGLGKN